MQRRSNDAHSRVRNLKPWGTFAILATCLCLGTGVSCRAAFPGTIYTFDPPYGGWVPYGGLITDGTNLFGTTTLYQTGPTGDGGVVYDGSVYECSTSGTLTSLYEFPKATDNLNTPASTLCEDADGNLYGVLEYGGPNGESDGYPGDGGVFELTASSGYTVAATIPFGNAGDDAAANDGTTSPAFIGGLLVDASRSVLYGVTYGSITLDVNNNPEPGSGGEIFSVPLDFASDMSPAVTDLAVVGTTATDGSYGSCATIIMDENNNLWLTASNGTTATYGSLLKCPKGTSTPYYSTVDLVEAFGGGSSHGANPQAGVTYDSDGTIWGTTENGGPYHYGEVFRYNPGGSGSNIWKETLFTGDATGAGQCPLGTLIFDSGSGLMYGTTTGYGDDGTEGTIFSATYSSGAIDLTLVQGSSSLSTAQGAIAQIGSDLYGSTVENYEGSLFGFAD